jgi:hypothetical protein
LVPFAVVMAASAAKEIFEDYVRIVIYGDG